MLRFRRALNSLEVKEVQLLGKNTPGLITMTIPPCLELIEPFAPSQWEEIFVNLIVQPLSSSVSDHCPLLLTPWNPPHFQPKFCFDSHRPRMSRYQDCVKEAWCRPVSSSHNPLAVLHIKLSRTTKALKIWSKAMIPQGKMAMTIYREVIAQLELDQESKNLTQEERLLIKKLKMRLFGLAGIEKSRARQKSRTTWLRHGDANTKFFHLMANNRKKKNYMDTMQLDNEIAITQAQKQHVVFNHFLHHTRTYVPRQCSLNFSHLGWEPKDLSHLEVVFSEQ